MITGKFCSVSVIKAAKSHFNKALSIDWLDLEKYNILLHNISYDQQ